jgi:hypothetical protein
LAWIGKGTANKMNNARVSASSNCCEWTDFIDARLPAEASRIFKVYISPRSTSPKLHHDPALVVIFGKPALNALHTGTASLANWTSTRRVRMSAIDWRPAALSKELLMSIEPSFVDTIAHKPT